MVHPNMDSPQSCKFFGDTVTFVLASFYLEVTIRYDCPEGPYVPSGHWTLFIDVQIFIYIYICSWQCICQLNCVCLERQVFYFFRQLDP